MAKKYTHIVETFIWDRPHWNMTREYLDYRLEFFHKYTLNSLLNQNRKDFKIFVQLGKKFKEVTDNYEWHPRVILCYNHGKSEYNKIDTPYLIISRIDSDDMYRNRAIEVIRKHITFSKIRRTVAVFRKNICWDMINDCILPHEKATSPFFTHVFPKKMYQNWRLFKKIHFAQHGNHGAGDRYGRELPKNNVCVIKHGQNISHIKRGQPEFRLSDEQKNILINLGKSDTILPPYDSATWDKDKMNAMLGKFGVREGI